MNFISYFNPLSNKHHACHDFKSLDGKNQWKAFAAAIFGGFLSVPILGLGGVAAFRKVVKIYTAADSSAATAKTAKIFAKKKTKVSAPDTNQFEQLIPTIENQSKQEVYKSGIKLLSDSGVSRSIQTFRLSNKEDYSLTDENEPDYFLNAYEPDADYLITSTPDFYDYAADPDADEYWTIFGNPSLGGRCFDYGSTQEETIVMETPDLADHIACHQEKYTKGERHFCTIQIREGDVSTRGSVAKGQANPYLMKGLHRVQEIKKDKTGVHAVPLPDIQEVNYLAIAAPKVKKNIDEQCDPLTAKDIFNTLMAGIAIVVEHSDPSKEAIIHSGRLGCGDYNNNPLLVYILHNIAAQHAGINIVMHGYSKKEAAEANSIMSTIPAQTTLGEYVAAAAHAVREHLEAKS